MIEHDVSSGFGLEVALPFAEAAQRTREALAAQGFGIVSEIDVAATLRRRLGEEVRPYLILGACDAVLAHRALAADPDIGLLLPCNVVVYATGDPARCVVAAADPTATLPLVRLPELAPLAALVATHLRAAIGQVAAAPAPEPVPLPVAASVGADDEIC